jgi:hypothetical protein
MELENIILSEVA